MFTQAVRSVHVGAAALAAALGLASCAVGPDFLHPAAPEITRYTKEPLAPRTSSTDAPTGQPQHFVQGRDIPQEWWRLFRSPALTALIQRALANNPSLQSAIATLRAANQAVYAQEGKFFPLVEGNFNPTNNQTSAVLSPIPESGATRYQLHTAQLQVTYTLDIWGLNRRTVESLQAQADNQRFQVEAAYLTLVSNIAVAAINEASLRAQIEATNQLISINTKMLGILRRQLETGYANRNDVALQEAALAQVAATLPPLRKALQQNRDLLSALAGVYPSEEPREIFKLEALHLPVDLPVSLPSQLIEQRPDIRASQELVAFGKRADRRRHRQFAAKFHDQRKYRLYEHGARRSAGSPKSCLAGCRQCRADNIRRRRSASSATGSEGYLQRGGLELSRHGDRRRAERH